MANFLLAHLCPAAGWYCLRRCRWFGCSARWWCCCWRWDSPWSPSFSSRLSPAADAALCGPRPAAAPGRPPAPLGPSACCMIQRFIYTFSVGTKILQSGLVMKIICRVSERQKTAESSFIQRSRYQIFSFIYSYLWMILLIFVLCNECDLSVIHTPVHMVAGVSNELATD